MQTEPPDRTSCRSGGIFCAVFVHEDCRKQDGVADQQGTGADALYCTLCEAEVLLCYRSKHPLLTISLNPVTVPSISRILLSFSTLGHPCNKLEVMKPLELFFNNFS